MSPGTEPVAGDGKLNPVEHTVGTMSTSGDGDWTELMMRARMTVDQEFEQRVSESEFSRQEWSLVMTAVEFDLHDPDDPETARLVGNTEKLPAVLPEMERVAGANPMTGAAPAPDEGGNGGRLLDSVKGALGLGGDDGPDEKKIAAAEALVDEYAERLQAELERSGQWEHVLAVAAHGDGEGEGESEDAGGTGDA